MTTGGVPVEVTVDATGVFVEVVADCPWDLDGSGGVGTTDLLVLLAAWSGNPGGPPDFDGDSAGPGITCPTI